MEQQGQFDVVYMKKLYTHEEIEGMFIAPTGTAKRDKYEKQLSDELQAYHVGEAIKRARVSKNLTQSELGGKIGVCKAQI